MFPLASSVIGSSAGQLGSHWSQHLLRLCVIAFVPRLRCLISVSRQRGILYLQLDQRPGGVLRVPGQPQVLQLDRRDFVHVVLGRRT